MPRPKRLYNDPDDLESPVSRTELRRCNKNKQIEIMKQWFGERYEDPVHSQPYCSEEGGYLFIDGGPFDAREELETEFTPAVKQEIIDELADELEIECWGWTHTAQYSDNIPDDFYEIDAILDEKTPLESLYKNLASMRQLLDIKDTMEDHLQKFQLIMIFGFCITSLETYLWHVFTDKVLHDEALKKKYIKAENRINGFKKTASQIYMQKEKLDDLISEIDAHVKRTLQDTTFHNVERTKKLYKTVLDVDIDDLDQFDAYIKKRHDFVHRGGKDKEGNDVETSKGEVEILISQIEEFCSNLDTEIASDDLSIF